MKQIIPFSVVFLVAGGCASSAQQHARHLNQEGVTLLKRQNYAAAHRCFLEAAELDRENATTFYHLGNAAHQLGAWSQAEQSYRACLERHPDHAPCRHALALLLLQQNRKSEAWPLIETWLTQRPKLADAHAEYGWLLRESGDLPAAQGQLQRALELDPGNVRALTELGMIYETYSYPDRAQSLYQRALKRDPEHPEIAARLARMSSVSGPRP